MPAATAGEEGRRTMVVAKNRRIAVRDFDPSRDKDAVEAVERMCDVGGSGKKMSLFTDLLGDPVCRVRNSPAYLMLVAETGEEVVGVIRGCIKTVTCGTNPGRSGKPPTPLHTKLAYILGLRVSPLHRRLGVAVELVSHLERWFRQMGAEYSYMATESDNEASVRLFTGRCGYSRFRTPSILVHPVFAGHRLRSPSSRSTAVIPLGPSDAELLYRRRLATTEFFPSDIDAVLANPLCLGTFLAAPRSFAWTGVEAFLSDPPESWAVLSVWNCKDVFRLEVRGASRARRVLAKATRAVDRALPWLRIPSIPDLFRPFGLYFLFGLGGVGPDVKGMVGALCAHAHNMAREGKCGVVATEVARCDPLREGIPSWKALSCEEDLWCVKRLGEDYGDGAVGDWTKSAPGPSIFVDPREF